MPDSISTYITYHKTKHKLEKRGNGQTYVLTVGSDILCISSAVFFTGLPDCIETCIETTSKDFELCISSTLQREVELLY